MQGEFAALVFLGAASGSVTTTGPLVRFRTTPPVSHQLRSRCQRRPAPRSTHQIVYSLTPGSPSGAWRSARRSVLSDQVAVPSASRSGARRTSARMRARSASF